VTPVNRRVVAHGMESNPIQEWLPYAEAGERLGVSTEAVRAKAIRKGIGAARRAMMARLAY
jgi:hypothetical protein